MKPTLLILAAGMGSRYGSLKQMEGVGPTNEAILDYSVYDAIRAGFGKVVFVIRDSFADDFKEVFNKERFNSQIEVDYVYQELDNLPEGYVVPEGRVKPWGTNHALMMAAPIINEPFAVINADDFYGEDAYKVMAEYLMSVVGESDKYCMVGYQVKNTLSDYGYVSRGVCSTDEDNNLMSIVERTQIGKIGEKIAFKDENDAVNIINEDTIVSMNMFGFTPDYFEYSQDLFKGFLDRCGRDMKSEFFLPFVANSLIEANKVSLKVLSSTAKWFGVTYKEDKPQVMQQLNGLIEDGSYPKSLWV